jgi:beta-lactamase class D
MRIPGPVTLMTLLCALCLAAPLWAGPPGVFEPLELSQPGDEAWLDGRDLVFYAEDLASGERYAYRRPKIEERHPPFSSFKIPHTLIALETGVASGLSHTIPYPAERRPAQSFWPQDWAQDQTLETAFQRSAAWYYQELALQIPTETYRGYLGHFGYGGGKIADGNDSFWLDGSLTVSPKEQVSFLRRLLLGQLEISPRAIEVLSRLSLAAELAPQTLHGKTGAGPVRHGQYEGPFEGWYVGWVERPGRKPVVFATWSRAPGFKQLKDFRLEATLRMLERMGVTGSSSPREAEGEPADGD